MYENRMSKKLADSLPKSIVELIIPTPSPEVRKNQFAVMFLEYLKYLEMKSAEKHRP